MAILTLEKRDVKVNGNFETNDFSMEANAQAFDILSSNIYKHKIRAVIREISCNAYDSHIAAGNPDQFDVHLPTYVEPWFSVRDYGVGLDHETATRLYTTYFWSNKGESNDFIGGMGIGSKVFFCLVDSATVTSWYNGTKTVYSCYKNEAGKPVIATLYRQKTDEPNGVEVRLDIENKNYEFRREAVNVFSFFKELPNINLPAIAEEISKKKEAVIIEGDNYQIEKAEYGNQLYLVMGNVGYLVPSEYNKYGISGRIEVPMGSVSFNAGREDLSLDERTQKYLEKAVDEVYNNLLTDFENSIEEEPTQFRKIFKFQTSKFGNTSLTNSVKNSDLRDKYKKPSLNYDGIIYYERSHRKTRRETTNKLPVDTNVEYYYNDKGYLNRIRSYLHSKSVVVLIKREDVAALGIDADFIKELSSLPKPPSTSTYVRCKTKVFQWNGDIDYREPSNNWDNAEVDNSEEKVYVEINRYEVCGCPIGLKTANRLISKYIGDINIYGLKTAFLKTKSFKTGKWISLNDYLKRELKKFAPEFIVEKSDEDVALYEAWKDVIDLSHMEEYVSRDTTDNYAFETIFNLEEKHLYDKIKELYEEYPMLQYVDSNSAKDPEVINYIRKVQNDRREKEKG